MKKMMTVLGMLFCFSAQAGIVMVSDQTMTFQGKPMSHQAKVLLDQDKSRVEMTGGMMSGQVVIYRKDKDLMWFVDSQKNTYTESSLEGLEKSKLEMEEKAKEMRAKMAAQGIKLPPAPTASPKPTFQKVGSGEKVGAWTCDHYEGTTEGKKTQDIWTTSPGAVGLSDADYQMMKNLSVSMKGEKSSMPFFGEGGLEGIPVKFIYYTSNGGSVLNELKEIRHEDVPSSAFEVPAGAKKSETPSFPNFKHPK